MKKLLGLMLFTYLLTGCSQKPTELERALSLRTNILQAAACSFDAEITADYGNRLCVFSMDCTFDEKGDLRFCVSSPETISGITGNISQEGGRLTFDESALYFPLLADGQLSPISAPWILMKALRSGYISSAGTDGAYMLLSVNDSYEEDALDLDVRINAGDIPEAAEICFGGKRILSLKLENMAIS